MAACSSDIEDVLKTYVERSATDGQLKLTPVMKCFDAAKLTNYKSVLESSVWPKHQSAAKKCTVKLTSSTILDDVAAFYVARKKSLKGKADMSDPEVQAVLKEIKDGIAALKNAQKKEQKMDAATKRLTDASGYTGSHKERFDADGKGKGMEGRKEMADNSGYVGNYKGQGSYAKK